MAAVRGGEDGMLAKWWQAKEVATAARVVGGMVAAAAYWRWSGWAVVGVERRAVAEGDGRGHVCGAQAGGHRGGGDVGGGDGGAYGGGRTAEALLSRDRSHLD